MSEHNETSVLYDVVDGIATINLNRPRYSNAQNSRMTCYLDTSDVKSTATVSKADLKCRQ
ncbi:MAG: hypothetical protein V3S33_00610 [Gammaproteobacteria bacterium]